MMIYEEMVKTGVIMDKHESDLYVPVTTETTAIIEKYEFRKNVRRFKCSVDGDLWYDIPFAYDPFWPTI